MSEADSSGVTRIGKKILVLEDEGFIQMAFDRLFRSMERKNGYHLEIFFASTVREAESIIERCPDLHGILLDGGLTHISYDGRGDLQPDIEILLFLKQLRTRYRSLPIVASSGSQSRNERLVREGCTTFAQKERAPKVLLDLLFPPPDAG